MRCGKTPTPEEAASMIMELRRRDPAAAKRGHGVIGEKRQWMKLEQTYTTAEFSARSASPPTHPLRRGRRAPQPPLR